MRIATFINWLLASLLMQVIPLHLAGAEETSLPSAAPSPMNASSVRPTQTPLPFQPALPDDGPRYDPTLQGQDSLQFQEALAVFKRGQYATARAGFDALAKLYPQSTLTPTTVAFLAELTMLEQPAGRGRTEAITQYRDLIRAYPNDTNSSRAQWRIGDLYVEMGWFHEAKVAYEHALSHALSRHDADRAMVGLGFTLMALRKWTEAEQTFEAIRKRATDDRLLMRATLGLAGALYAQHRKRDVQPLFDILHRRWPDLLRKHPDALQQYGDVLFETNRLQQAREIYTLLYNLYPSHQDAGSALVRLGDSCRQLGLRKHAVLFYVAVQSQYAGSPAEAVARMRLAQIEQQVAVSAGEDLLRIKVEGMIRGATASYLEPSELVRRYTAIATEHEGEVLGSEALFHLAEHHEWRGDWTGATQVYQAITRRAGKVEHDPWPRAAGLRLAAILKPWLEAALNAQDDFSVVTLFHRHGQAPEQYFAGTGLLLQVADTHRRLGFSIEAVHLYQTLVRDIQAAAFHEPALIGLGQSYLDQQDPVAARKVFERFRLQYPLSPYSTLVSRQLTTAMLHQGDRPGAVRFMRQWLQLHQRDPERGWMHLTLARTLAGDRKSEEAVAAFEEGARHKLLQAPSDLLMFADLLTRANKHQRALELYQRVLASRPELEQAEWARLQIVRNLASQKQFGPARAVLMPGAGSGDPLLLRATAAFQTSLRATNEKEGE